MFKIIVFKCDLPEFLALKCSAKRYKTWCDEVWDEYERFKLTNRSETGAQFHVIGNVLHGEYECRRIYQSTGLSYMNEPPGVDVCRMVSGIFDIISCYKFGHLHGITTAYGAFNVVLCTIEYKMGKVINRQFNMYKKNEAHSRDLRWNPF